jgi:hypothetical protein
MNRLAPSISVVALLACNSRETQPRADSVTSPPTLSASVGVTAATSALPPQVIVVYDPAAPSTQPTDAGAIWGDTISDSFGAGGIGLTGDSGARGEGIGLGNVGTLGHGGGTGTGQSFSSGHGRLGGDHHVSAPRVRQGYTTMTGQLPPEVINRITRQSFGRFKLCYTSGLEKDPKLTGTVTTRFVIDEKGAVSKTESDPSTTMPNADVVACIGRGFSTLSFPQPTAGVVTVTFPLVFEPGGVSN